MNTREAKATLAPVVADYRKRSYVEWAACIGKEPITFDVTAASGRQYQVEIVVVWDDKPGGDVRVMFSIDDGGWRAFCPLVDDFLIAEDGSFVGE